LYFTRHVPWFWCTCWLLITGVIFTAVVGAQHAFVRLTISAFPLVILLIAKYVDLVVYMVKELGGQKFIEYTMQYLKEQNTL